MAVLRRHRDPQGLPVPTFWYADEAAKASARERIGRNLSVGAAHLQRRPHLVGESFTVADAYFAWSLMLLRRAGVDIAEWPALAAYLERVLERPAVRQAVAIEQELRKTVTF